MPANQPHHIPTTIPAGMRDDYCPSRRRQTKRHWSTNKHMTSRSPCSTISKKRSYCNYRSYNTSPRWVSIAGVYTLGQKHGRPFTGTSTAPISRHTPEVHLNERAPDHTCAVTRRKFRDLFQPWIKQSPTITTKHTIRLIEDKIVCQMTYPLPPRKKALLYRQVDEFLQAGVIELSQSSYASPPVIEKPKKKTRFCVDYRLLITSLRTNPRSCQRFTKTWDTWGTHGSSPY